QVRIRLGQLRVSIEHDLPHDAVHVGATQRKAEHAVGAIVLSGVWKAPAPFQPAAHRVTVANARSFMIGSDVCSKPGRAEELRRADREEKATYTHGVPMGSSGEARGMSRGCPGESRECPGKH